MRLDLVSAAYLSCHDALRNRLRVLFQSFSRVCSRLTTAHSGVKHDVGSLDRFGDDDLAHCRYQTH